MPEDTNPAALDAMQPDTVKPDNVGAAPTNSDTPKTFDEEYVKSLRAEAAQRRKEAKDLSDRLATFEQAEKARKDKELAEQGKFQELLTARESELDTLKRQIAEQGVRLLRVQIAAEFNLTPMQAARLQGSTDDEIRADAQSLIEAFGLKPSASAPTAQPIAPTPAPTAPTTKTTIVPGGTPPATSEDTIRARRSQKQIPIFTMGKSTTPGD